MFLQRILMFEQGYFGYKIQKKIGGFKKNGQ